MLRSLGAFRFHSYRVSLVELRGHLLSHFAAFPLLAGLRKNARQSVLAESMVSYPVSLPALLPLLTSYSLLTHSPHPIHSQARWTPQECSSERSCGKHGQLPCFAPRLTPSPHFLLTILSQARWTPQECSSERSCGKHGQLPCFAPRLTPSPHFLLPILSQARWAPQECSSERSCGKHGQLPCFAPRLTPSPHFLLPLLTLSSPRLAGLRKNARQSVRRWWSFEAPSTATRSNYRHRSP
jgi:hypothetical protein